MSERDDEFLAISEREIFEEARDRLKISYDATSDNRNAAKDDMLFREGENHWNQKNVTTASEQQPELVINFTDTLVTRVVNSIADLETRGKCHPIADGADAQVADTLTGLGRHVEARSDAQVAYDIATDNAVTYGWGWFRLRAEFAAPDSFDKEIRIDPIMNSMEVYEDPTSIMPTASDMNWALISFKMQRTEYKRQNPKADMIAWADADDAYRGDWEDKETIRLAEYFRIRETTEKLFRIRVTDPKTGEIRYVNSYESEMPATEELTRIGAQVVDERESSRRQVEWFKLNGTKVIAREILPGSYIPLVRVQGNAKNIDGKIYRRGMVRALQDPQRMVDYGEVAKIKRLGLTPQSPWVVAEGQLNGHPEWEDDHIAPRKVLTYKPVTVQTGQGEVPLPPPQRQPPAQVEAGFAEFVGGMRSNLLAIAGMPNESGQDERGQVVSGRAIQRRDKLSDLSHSQYYKAKKLAVAQGWRILLEWYPHYYSEERMQRIVGGDGKPQMVEINKQIQDADGITKIKNDLTVGRYDVVMEAGPSHETRREEGAESLLELTGSPSMGPLIAKVAPDLVFRSMDFDYAEEIADRLAAQTPDGLKKIMENLPKEARAVVQSLASENENLKQALQAAQVEIKYGITKAHLAATVKAHDVEESNKTKRTDTESRERTTITVHHMDNEAKLRDTEIKAGAEIIGKHQDAGYEAIARREIEQSAAKAEGSA